MKTSADWISLTGLMGSGKSTVGRILAERLGRPFYDLDMEIERAEGRTISDIFAADGEIAFRDLESVMLDRILSLPAGVLSCGGGTVIVDSNRTLLAAAGKVFWLDLAPELAAERASVGGRPLLDGVDPAVRMANLYDDRRDIYAQADHRVNAAGSPDQVVDEILDYL